MAKTSHHAPADELPEEGGPDALAVLAYVAFVLVGGLLVFGFARAVQPAIASEAQGLCRPLEPSEPIARLVPRLEAQTLDGAPVKLESLRGKLVVLNFWATWCEPCTREWPELDKLSARLQGRDDVVVVAVSLDKEPGDIPAYLARMGLEDTTVQVWWDPSGEGNVQFGGEKLPDTYFVDAEGVFRQAFINVRQWGSPTAYRCVSGMARR